jgi:peroxiredoxin
VRAGDGRARSVGLAMKSLLCLLVVLGALTAPVLARRTPATGDEAPPFSLPDLEGRQVSPGSFKGRLVILHFWATWCPVCRDEMPILEEAARARAADLVVLGVNLGEKRETVAAYVRDAAITFPILLDARGRVASAYGVLALPITIIVGRDGRIADAVRMGSLDRASLDERLTRLLRPGPD